MLFCWGEGGGGVAVGRPRRPAGGFAGAPSYRDPIFANREQTEGYAS